MRRRERRRDRGGERISKQVGKSERERGRERAVPTEQWLLSEFICAVASQVNPLNGSK